VRNAIDDSGFLDQVIGIVSRCLGVSGGVSVNKVFYLSSKFEIREFCYTYVLYFVFCVCAQCNRRFGFFEVRL